MVLNNVRKRGSTVAAESLYVLGLASIIANAAELGRHVKPGDADTVLYIATFAIEEAVYPYLIMPILGALEPLRDRAPHRYLQLLPLASDIENLNRDTVRYIFDGLNKVLDNYGDSVKGHARSLVHAMRAYVNLLRRYRGYFKREEVKGAVGRVADLLKEIGKINSGLGIIAWAYALTPALKHKSVRELMEGTLGIDVVNEANKVLKELNKLRENVQELMRVEEFMSYVESKSIKADEEAVRGSILNVTTHLKHYLGIYRFNNDELDEAARLFNEAAEERREIGGYRNYLVNRGRALRVEAIEGSLVGDKLVDEFRQLYEEAFNKEHFKPTAQYLTTASARFGNYLVSLALTGGDERVKKIKELLKEHWRVLGADYEASVLTRLMLNALLGPKDRLDNELGGKLVVKPEELIEAFKDKIYSKFLPALMVTFGVIKPENGIKLCEEFTDHDCIYSVFAAEGKSDAVEQLREKRLITFHKRILKEERLDLLKGLGLDAESLNDEYKRLVGRLDGKSLVQLLAPRSSMARLALMLHALINGDEKLSKV